MGLGHAFDSQKMRGHTYWYEEVANGGGKVQQSTRAERAHQARYAAELVEVVRDADKGQDEQHVAVAGVAVLAQHVQHPGGVLVPGDDAAIGPLAEEVKEAVGGVAVVTGEGQEGELAVSAERSAVPLEREQE